MDFASSRLRLPYNASEREEMCDLGTYPHLTSGGATTLLPVSNFGGLSTREVEGLRWRSTGSSVVSHKGLLFDVGGFARVVFLKSRRADAPLEPPKQCRGHAIPVMTPKALLRHYFDFSKLPSKAYATSSHDYVEMVAKQVGRNSSPSLTYQDWRLAASGISKRG